MAAPAASSGAGAAATVPASSTDPHRLASRLDQFAAHTVWQEFTPLAKASGAVNLGQGFPDWPSPRFVKDALIAATNAEHNQYTRSAGHPPLVQALARRYSPLFGRALNWETEVTVGVGSTEALYAVMQALVEPGDEVVLISPAFDIYAAQVLMAGGRPVYVPLRTRAKAASAAAGADAEQEWYLDMDELRAAFTPRTRAIVLNTPQNPTGKMLTRAELESVAAIMRDFPQAVAVADEVYENMTHDGREHVRLASLPGMWERCITVTSAGKTFSVTGWKIGWAIGPEALIKGLVLVNQWVQFSVSTPAQQAVADCLEAAERPYAVPAPEPAPAAPGATDAHGGAVSADGATVTYPSYYAWLRAEYARKRDILAAGLTAAGLRPIMPEGGFFIMADTRDVEVPAKYLAESSPACGPVMRRDWALCRFLTSEIGVAAIPPSAFYQEDDKHLAANVARFAFCKEDASLHEAAARLLRLRPYLKGGAAAAAAAGGGAGSA